MKRSSISITFGGERWVLDGRETLFHAKEECLIVSDLHLEKASFLAGHGSPLPRYDTRDTLLRLQQLIADYRPRKIICLGDSFHDAKSHARIEASDQALLSEMITSIEEWHWVLGNHDMDMPRHLPGFYTTEYRIAGVSLLHQPMAVEAPQIVGHYHPKCRYSLGGGTVRGKVFIHNHRLMIMPAFGAYTGGLSVKHEVIHSFFDEAELYLCYRHALWKIPFKETF